MREQPRRCGRGYGRWFDVVLAAVDVVAVVYVMRGAFPVGRGRMMTADLRALYPRDTEDQAYRAR